jgi:hypothetical protein
MTENPLRKPHPNNDRMRPKMLIKPTVLRSGNRPQTRMDTRLLNQLRRLMLYPTELRAGAYSLRFLLSFLTVLAERSANSFQRLICIIRHVEGRRGFDSLHPLQINPYQTSGFPSESAARPSTTGRGIGPNGAYFSHVFCGVA